MLSIRNGHLDAGGIRLEEQKETAETADVFNDLRLEKSEHPAKPLFSGEWR